MMNKLTRMFRELPIKWKLMLGATALIFLLFASYNFAQYVVLKHWMLNQEKDKLQVNRIQIQAYMQEKTSQLDALQMAEIRLYIEKMIGKHQLIRVIGSNDIPIVSVSNHFDEAWVAPKSVTTAEVIDITFKSDHLLVNRSPIRTSTFQGTLELVSNLETFDHFSRTLLLVMLIGGILAIFISAICGLAIARQFMYPIRALATAIRNVKEKGLTERVVNIQNGDELSSLTQLFNELMNQLEISFRQQKQFVEDASHELRTPITILEGHLSLLDRWGKSKPEILEESLEASLQETRRLKGIVQDLLTLTKVETQVAMASDNLIHAAPIIHETMQRVKVLHPDFEFQLKIEGVADVRLGMNSLHFEQILLIVIENAIKYTNGDKLIVVEAVLTRTGLLICIEDHGMGIPEQDVPYVFDRFYRVDKSRNREIPGTGLGLSIAKQIVLSYNGEITIQSEEDIGTKVLIKLPLSRSDK
ncbi:two-component sensor histidine kinase [Paenibacillus marchantiophytorum]|uniref:Signal transduction histidine-protein kinase ArlS n=1 Tax=Paenibacillus marchantiophytorum TaxID=1619310 RepID=A0ABQ1FIR6_9BACL|nr:HAMP domain-containing histidine kinase [Paenibacillus marchantiophytorum]GGA14593.1 two-component sensor histidine kinase [Paenibacillus marchantiophytorum]